MNDQSSERWKSLIRESTVELVRRIVENADSLALKVLLDTRRLFNLKGGQPLLLPEYLMKLRNWLLWEDFETDPDKLADCAYDLTLAKYTNFPSPPDKSPSPSDHPVKAMGVDCRNYYRAFLRLIQREIAQGKIRSQSEEEFYAGKILQNRVSANFFLSKEECKRDTLFSIRYTWEVKGIKLTLWYPSYLTPKEFKAWLEENVKDLDPKEQKNEQRRIQSLIDENLRRGYHIYLDESGVSRTLSTREEPSSIELREGHIFVDSLAEAVAKEKIENFYELRPAIRKLGQQSVHRLILRIFSDLAKGDYEATLITEQYHINKSTFSRFAGHKWGEKTADAKAVTIPDLWQNTAETLASNPVFMETVLTSGVAGKFKTVLTLIKSQEGEGDGC